MISRTRGFTLIELMITLVIFSFLVMMGVQLTKSWTDSAKQREAANLLKQGISRAKATALRNPGAALGDAPAAVLCRTDAALKLFSLTNQGTISCTSTSNILWQTSLPATATIQTSGADITCIAFNARGLPVSGGNTCSTSPLNVTVGSESAITVEII